MGGALKKIGSTVVTGGANLMVDSVKKGAKLAAGAVKKGAGAVLGDTGKGGKMPATPDYSSLATKDAMLSKAALDYSTSLNRPTQINPFGSVAWTGHAADPFAKAGTPEATNTLTQTENYDPRIMQAYDNLFGLQKKTQDQLNNQQAFNYADAPQYDPNSGAAAGNAMFQSAMSRMRPQQQFDVESMTTKLRQQGLQPGSAAFDRAMKNLLTSQGDVNAKSSLDATTFGNQESRNNYATQLAGHSAGYNQAVQKYALPWTQAGQVNQQMASQFNPIFSRFNQAGNYNPASMAGAAQSAYQNQMGKYSSDQAKSSDLLGTIGGVAGAYFGGPIGATVGSTVGPTLGGMGEKHVR